MIRVQVFVDEDLVRVADVNTDDQDLALELALEHVRDHVTGEVQAIANVDLAADPDVIIDPNDRSVSDAAMLAGAVQAGRAYGHRLAQQPERAARVDELVTGLLIFDHEEAFGLIGLLEGREEINPVLDPLMEQLIEFVAGVAARAA